MKIIKHNFKYYEVLEKGEIIYFYDANSSNRLYKGAIKDHLFDGNALKYEVKCDTFSSTVFANKLVDDVDGFLANQIERLEKMKKENLEQWDARIGVFKNFEK